MKEFGLRFSDSDNRIEATPPRQDHVDLAKLLAAMRRQLRVILWAAGCGAVLGLGYIVTTPKIYMADATVLLSGGASRGMDDTPGQESAGTMELGLESAAQVIRSGEIAVAVVEMLHLDLNEDFLDPPESLAGRMTGAVRKAPGAILALISGNWAADSQEQRSAAQLKLDSAAQLQKGVQIERKGRSTVFMIAYASHDAALATSIANAYADAYKADVLNANFDVTEQTTQWLQERLIELETQSHDAALEVERFRNANGLVASQGELMTEQRVVRLNTALADAVGETARVRALVETYARTLKISPTDFIRNGDIGFNSDGDIVLDEMQQRLASLGVQLQRVEKDFGPDHPQALLLRSRIEGQLQALLGELGRLHEAALNSLDIALAGEAALRASLATAVSLNETANTARVQLSALEQKAETLTTLYQTFLSRFQEVAQQKSFPVSNVRILSHASLPKQAYEPRTSRVLALMLVLGGMAGCCIGMIREFRDGFLRIGADVQSNSGQRFFGYLPMLGASKAVDQNPGAPFWRKYFRLLRSTSEVPGQADEGRAPGDLWHAISNPRSQYAETLRHVLLGVDLAMAGKTRRIVGVTSIRPGEGKTSVATNLAGLLASNGASVLLIDCDPRSPGLSHALNMTGLPSLTEAVLGTARWQDAVAEEPVTGLHVMPCITPQTMAQTCDLIRSPGMRKILVETGAAYDHVILDMAPLGPVVDARSLLPYIDGVVLVTEWGKTSTSLLREEIAAEPALAEKLLGVVLNKVDMAALKTYAAAMGAEQYLDQYEAYMTPEV